MRGNEDAYAIETSGQINARIERNGRFRRNDNNRQNRIADTQGLTAGSSLAVEYPPRQPQGYDKKGQQKKDIIRHRRQALAAHKNF